MPADTVHTPSAKRLGRQLRDGVHRAANLEGADRLKDLELQEDFRVAAIDGIEPDERRSHADWIDTRRRRANRLDGNVPRHCSGPDLRQSYRGRALTARSMLVEAELTRSASAGTEAALTAQGVTTGQLEPHGDRINRREFMATTAAAGLAGGGACRSRRAAPAVIVQGSTRPVVIASGNGNTFQERRHQDLRRDGVRDDDGRDGEPSTCSTRSSPASTSSSSIRPIQRRLRRAAERRRRRAARLVLHARAEEEGRRRRRASKA